MPAATALPSGTVTFLFTDIEGSTTLVRSLGPDRFRDVLADHARILREAVEAAGGQEVRTEGDSFFCVFTQPSSSLIAVVAAQRALASHVFPHVAELRVRMGLHTGEASLADADAGTDYVGFEVHRAARIAAAGHGGQVLLSDPTRALVQDALPPGAALRDLGEHRFKDLPRPERVWQLSISGLREDFPPLRSVEEVLLNLPTPLTSFVGRQKEIAEGLRLLDGTRLLTLTGPGGTGKTRLCLEIARRAAAAFRHGVHFVPLATIRDPDLVAPSIAEALRLPAAGTRPMEEHLVEQLQGRSALLVLDNFEQILAAAPVVARLLAALPQLKAVVTSRAALHLYGEQEYPVPPLAMPAELVASATAASLSQFEAVRLFIERARAARPSFEVTNENAPAVAEICSRLDGLPLAIELAAARIKLLAPAAILSRLASGLAPLGGGTRDLPERQQTLRGAIAWSYDLLDAPARLLFARLGVFSGGAALADVEAIVGGLPGAPADALEGVAGLAEQSLLRLDTGGAEPRALMLETIREFARDKLSDSGELAMLEERHARHFLAVAGEAAPHLLSAHQVEWLDRLERDIDNLRAAFDWFCARKDAEPVMRFTGALWRFWQRRGHLAEARERAERALALPGLDQHEAALAGALEAAGGIAYWQGDPTAAQRFYERALELSKRSGDRGAIANALYNLAFSVGLPRPTEATVDHLRQALAIWTELGDRAGRARALWAIADMDAFLAGRLEEAQAGAEESIVLFRELDDSFGLAWALFLAGGIALERQNLVLARERLDESLEILARVRDVSGVSILLTTFGKLAEVEGDRVRAVRLAGAREAVARASGTGLALILDQSEFGGPIGAIAESEGGEWRLGRDMSVEQAIAYALRKWEPEA